MSNKSPRTGANHERHIKLSAEQREAIIGRWPVRFTTGQALADRALWVMYREQVVYSAPATTQQERALGSNAVDLELQRQPEVVPNAEETNLLNTPDTAGPVYDLDAIRKAVHSSYPLENGESYDKEVA